MMVTLVKHNPMMTEWVHSDKAGLGSQPMGQDQQGPRQGKDML